VNDTILATSGLTREFGGFVAVNDVTLRVERGTIHALIGPNGAGKTTCFNLLTKFLSPTRGTIEFKGRDITRLSPAQVARLGLVRSFQISAVFPHLSALENVRLALQRSRGASFDFWRSESALRIYDDRARALLEDVGLSAYVETPAGLLSYGRKRALEIATTLALEPEMMLLDEPTAGMTHEDVDRVVQLIHRIREGRTILMVEHNLSVVEGLCDTITVLTRGRILAEGNYASVSKNPEVTLLGRNGAGKTTTMKSIMGLVPRREGSVRYQGRETIGLASNHIARAGIALCPEERGIFGSLSVTENLLLPPIVAPGGLSVDEIYTLFPNLKERASTSQGTKLSGGEQQMLAIGRILRTGAKMLLLDEPTEGLAPVIVQQIGRTIREIKARGFTVLLVEQNFRFAATVADRHYVMEHGKIIDMIPNEQLESSMDKLHDYLGV
jgi:branched-chain amino acid transport system ATP-binding protein